MSHRYVFAVAVVAAALIWSTPSRREIAAGVTIFAAASLSDAMTRFGDNYPDRGGYIPVGQMH